MSQPEDKWERKMEEEVTCPICRELFEDPKILAQCHHVYCGDCMNALLQRNRSVFNLECPICRVPFTEDEISSSFFVKNIVELYREQQEQRSAPRLSRHYSEDEPKSKTLPAKAGSVDSSSGIRRAGDSASGIRRAGEPPRQSSFDNPAASTFVGQMADEARKQLQEIAGPLRDNHNSVLSAIDTLEATKLEFQAKHDIDCEAVKGFFRQMRGILDHQEEKCLQSLNEITTSALKLLGQQTYDLSDLESQLKSCNATLSSLLETKNQSRIVAMERRVALGASDLDRSVKQAKLSPLCVPNTNILCSNPESFVKSCESLCHIHSAPYPANCTIQFVTDRIVPLTQPITVSIDLRDIQSNPVMNQSDQLEISTDQEDGFIERTMVTEVTPGIYDVCYFPRVRNAHKININYVDTHDRRVVVATVDIPSLLACRYELNQQRVLETYGGNKRKFNRPCGLALGPNDEIVVSDRGNNQLIVFDSQQRFLHAFGQKGSGNGEFNCPSGLAISTEGLIYVADRYNNRIQKVRLDNGQFVSKIGKKGTGNGEFKEPQAVALTSRGLLYVADGFNHRVQVFNKEEKFIFSFGRRGNGPGEFDVPISITFNQSEDKVFVSDNRNNRVQVFTVRGEYIQMFGDFTGLHYQLKEPRCVYQSKDGHIVISCSGHAVILVFKEDGSFVKAMQELIVEIAINSRGQIIATSHKGLIISENLPVQ